MDKLYDLMTTGFKYQVVSCKSGDELYEVEPRFAFLGATFLLACSFRSRHNTVHCQPAQPCFACR